ncbi:MAG: HAD family hydrolase [Candidatus Aenigmatarchaeota archaeon]
MGTVKLLICDFEGTLAYYEKKANPIDATNLIRALGHEIYFQKWEAARRFVFFVDIPKKHIHSWDMYMADVFRRLDEHIERETVKQVADYYRDNTILRFYEDVPEIFSLPVKKCVATTMPRFYYPDMDLSGFDAVMTSLETGTAKGHPYFFTKAIKDFGVQPDETLVVGNDLYCDIIPAEELGIGTVLIDRDNNMSDYRGRKIRSLSELHQFFAPACTK